MCKFIVETASISIPVDTIPVFDALYAQRVGSPNDIGAVAFYSEIKYLMNSRLLTPRIQQQVLDCFQISTSKKQPLLQLQQKREARITIYHWYAPIGRIVMRRRMR